MSVGRWLSLVLSLLVVSSTLFPPEVACQSRSKREAGSLAEEARAAFGSKDFLRAAELLSQAFDQYPEPNFVWNMGRAYELGGETEQAVATYLRFAALDISEDERDTALDRAARLRAAKELPRLLREAQDGAELVSLRAKVDRLQSSSSSSSGGDSGPSRMELIGWSATGAGMVALGTVLTLHLASLSTVEDYHETASEGRDRGKYDAYKDTLQTRVVVSQVLAVSGILLAGAGATLLFLEYFDGDSETAPAGAPHAPAQSSPSTPSPASSWHVAPLVAPDTAGIGLGGSF